MYCPNCKKEYPKGTAFCGTCGSPLIEKPKKPKKKRPFLKGLLCGLLIMAVLAGTLGAVLHFTGGSGSRGCGSPEDAVKAFMKAAKAGDMEAMLDTFAMEEYVENFDLAEYSEWIKIVTYSVPEILPGTNEFFRGITVERRRGYIANKLTSSYLNRRFPEQNGKPFSIGGRPGAYSSGSDLVKALDTEDLMEILDSIKVREIIPGEEIYREMKKKGIEENREKQAERDRKFLGCDETTEYVVKFDMDGETWYLNLSLVKYGSRWFIKDIGGMLGTLAQASAGLMEEEQYEDMIEKWKE